MSHSHSLGRRLLLVSLLLMITACGGRTGLKGRGEGHHGSDGGTNEPPVAICPEEAYASPGRPAVLHGDGEDDVGIAEWLWSVVAAPGGSIAAPAPAHSRITSFDPDAVGDFTLRLTVSDGEGLEAGCDVVVHSVVGPPIAFCPDDMLADVGIPVDLHGDGYDDNWIEGFLWEIVARPDGSIAALEFDTMPDARLTPDITGAFRIRLTVTDNDGLTGDCEFIVMAGGVPTAVCPDDMTVPTRTEVTLHGDAVDDGTIVSWAWEVVSHDTDTPPTLGSPGSQDTTFWALRVGRYEMQLTVVDDTGLTGSCTFTVTTTPTGPTAICPPTIETTPLTEVELVGDGEDDGSIVGWLWELASSPTGSSAAGPAPAMEKISYFTPDVAGEYHVQLTVTDDDGLTGSCDCLIRAIPSEGLRIEIYWNPTSSTDNSDVDLHLLHPASPTWFHDSGDCFYGNCNASSGMILEWDAPAYTPDNPRLDIDDVTGYGPENINIDIPVAGHTYTVGVHYYSDHGFGPSQVYLKIFCGTISMYPVYEVGPTRLLGSSSPMENDFWKVAEVAWDGFGCSVIPIDSIVLAREASASR